MEGVSWLAADMRLQCYTSEWIGYGLLFMHRCRLGHLARLSMCPAATVSFDSLAVAVMESLLGPRYAAYALLCGAVYVVGFPMGILVLLFRRRHKLFGSDADPFVATTRTKYGFLYEVRLMEGHGTWDMGRYLTAVVTPVPM